MKRPLWILAALLFVIGCGPERQPLTLALLFSDHAVLQRDAPIRIWGDATPGERVVVTLAEQRAETQAGADGSWEVTLDARPAGGPFELIVEAGADRIARNQILLGDVWVASGQSNMEWPVQSSNQADTEIAGANDSAIRHFKVPRTWSYAPETHLATGQWEAASPETVGDFSAVGYFFARQLRESEGVPIGIINSSWGGSRIEPWMSAETLKMSEEDVAELRAGEERALEEARARLEAQLGSVPERDPGLVDGQAVWADPELDTANWDTLSVPGAWERRFPRVDGIAWYRTTFRLTAQEATAGAVLGAGQIDDSDITWVNGVEVGRTEGRWNQPRTYPVPADVLREGDNVIAIRVEDTGGAGGIWGPPDQVYLQVGTRREPLAGVWSFRFGQPTTNAGMARNQIPTLLYNKMVKPLIRYPVRGFIWYQGESNVANAADYAGLFQDMIGSWRADWAMGDLPFLWVQLANFLQARPEPSESDWAALREAQSEALVLPLTGQAVIIDIGEADDIHPRNKQEVGYRLALAARAIAYGDDGVVYSGPVYRTHEIQGNRVIVAFDHVGSGLTTRGAAPGGFAIAGQDGVFRWARAQLAGDRVVLSHPAVPRPAHVRYAWADNPDRANLYNLEGLPAAPFRTDRP